MGQYYFTEDELHDYFHDIYMYLLYSKEKFLVLDILNKSRNIHAENTDNIISSYKNLYTKIREFENKLYESNGN